MQPLTMIPSLIETYYYVALHLEQAFWAYHLSPFTFVVKLSFRFLRKRRNHINIGADRLASPTFCLTHFWSSLPDLSTADFLRISWEDQGRDDHVARARQYQQPPANAVESDPIQQDDDSGSDAGGKLDMTMSWSCDSGTGPCAGIADVLA